MNPVDPTINPFYHSNAGKNKKKVKEGKKVSFGQMVKAESEEAEQISAGTGLHLEFEHNLEESLDSIYQCGERLKREPVFRVMKEYREAIREFMALLLSNNYELETIEGAKFNPLKKQKRYTLVKTLDKKLEDLAAHVLNDQKKQLVILQKVDEIHGILVDLLS